MTTRAEIIAEAREWIGTPYRHQGRLKHIASDCVGMLICVPRALGIFPPGFDVNGYKRDPDPEMMRSLLNLHLDRVLPGVPQPGDILWIRPHDKARHLALYTFDNTVIHAIDKIRGVAEHIFDERWRRSVSGVWRYRGVDD